VSCCAPTILVVDDDTRSRELLARHLQQRGVDVFLARDGREGLVMMQQLKPDLVLLDLQMPVLDGFGFLLEKSRDPVVADTPVSVLTARDLGPSEAHWLRQVAVRVLTKADQPLDAVAEPPGTVIEGAR
jgi:CheY-like chemotaxis protein